MDTIVEQCELRANVTVTLSGDDGATLGVELTPTIDRLSAQCSLASYRAALLFCESLQWCLEKRFVEQLLRVVSLPGFAPPEGRRLVEPSSIGVVFGNEQLTKRYIFCFWFVCMCALCLFAQM
jgi:hypothetical protein